MTIAIFFILPLPIVLPIVFSRIAAHNLQSKFASIRPLQGKSLNFIQSFCGRPARKVFTNGLYSCLWKAGKYRIILGFNQYEICTEIQYERIL